MVRGRGLERSFRYQPILVDLEEELLAVGAEDDLTENRLVRLRSFGVTDKSDNHYKPTWCLKMCFPHLGHRGSLDWYMWVKLCRDGALPLLLFHKRSVPSTTSQ